MLSSSRIEELRTKFEENPRRYFAPLANEYRKAGRIDDAIALCREQLARYPDHMSGHIVLGQSLYESRALDEAGRVFETAVALDGENLIALRHLGDIARERGELDTARGWYGRVLDADPHHEDVAAQLAALGAGASVSQRGLDEGAPDIELPSFAGALAAALDAPEAHAPTAGADGISAWEPASLDDLITRSDDVIVLDAPAEDDAIVLSPSLLEPEPLLDGASEPVAGLEFDPVVGLDEPPVPLDRAPLVGFDPSPVAAAAPLPPLDLHFDDFSAESLRPAGDAGPTPAEGSVVHRWDDEPADLDLPPLDDDAPAPTGGDEEERARTPADAEYDVDEFEEVALGAPVPSATEALPDLVDEHDDGRDDGRDEALAASAPPAPAFVTETMAELYLQQGFTQQALDVYRELAALRPSDDMLALRVAAVEAQLSSAAAATEVQPTRAPESGADEAPTADAFEVGRPAEPAGARAPDVDDEAERATAFGDDVEIDAASVASVEHASVDPSEVNRADASDIAPPSPESATLDGGFDLVDVAPAGEGDRSEAVADSPAVAEEALPQESPLSARAFFASLAVRRPTPALDVAPVSPAASQEMVAEAAAPDAALGGRPELPTAAARPTLESLFADAPPTSADEQAAQRLASAFGPGDERAPALMADTERSAVARIAAERAAAAARPAPAPVTPPAPGPFAWAEPRPATPAAPAAYSFDKFFADVPETEPAAPAAPVPAAPAAPAESPAAEARPTEEPAPARRPEQSAAAPAVPAASGDDDIEQFNEWLRGLRES